jgi:homoserine dehydrogenase
MKLNIGMVGGGVVGGGVYELLAKHPDVATISKICVRDATKARDFAVDPATTSIVTDIQAILGDPSIDCVIELMGGVGLAKDAIFGAISANKHVITANKALVASQLTELTALLAAHPTVMFGYEAAVCGGIPIINVLQQGFPGDDISEVFGIMNGTTNFMLTKMAAEGATYAAALAEAQALGFAEADPTADVEGHDVQAKIALVAKLAFGTTVDVAAIKTSGISAVDAIDFEYAKAMGATVKLLGTARKGAADLSVYVMAHMVPLAHAAANAPRATNVVHMTTANLGGATFVGPGAGRFPTANSVVADVFRVARAQMPPPFPLQTSFPLASDFEAKFYIRVTTDGQDMEAEVTAAAAQAGVVVTAVAIPVPDARFTVVTTAACAHSAVATMVAALAAHPALKMPPLIMSML